MKIKLAITLVIIFAFLAAIVSSLATNLIVSNAAMEMAKEKFYQGAISLCVTIPERPNSTSDADPRMFSSDECADMAQQMFDNNFFEQSLGTENTVSP